MASSSSATGWSKSMSLFRSGDDLVVVDIDDPGAGGDLLGHLMDVPLGGQAGADVDELPDAGLVGQEAHGAAEEAAVLPRHVGGGGLDRDDLFGEVAVDLEVVLAVEPVVVDPGHVRRVRIEAGRKPLQVCQLVSSAPDARYGPRAYRPAASLTSHSGGSATLAISVSNRTPQAGQRNSRKTICAAISTSSLANSGAKSGIGCSRSRAVSL